MINLALLGKNIKHSKSAMIYQSLLDEKVKYHLLDYQNEKEVPRLEDLFIQHDLDGLSITSPYKRLFSSEITNCIKKDKKDFLFTNTDYSALKDLFIQLMGEYGKIHVAILGNGAMSSITKKFLVEKNIEFNIFCRREIPDLKGFNLKNFFSNLKTNFNKAIIVNSCAREFVFEGDLPSDCIFWDYNYDFSPHQTTLPDKVEKYLDGFGLLELQARYAIKFWGL